MDRRDALRGQRDWSAGIPRRGSLAPGLELPRRGRTGEAVRRSHRCRHRGRNLGNHGGEMMT
jgi:hypothetical protein